MGAKDPLHCMRIEAAAAVLSYDFLNAAAYIYCRRSSRLSAPLSRRINQFAPPRFIHWSAATPERRASSRVHLPRAINSPFHAALHHFTFARRERNIYIYPLQLQRPTQIIPLCFPESSSLSHQFRSCSVLLHFHLQLGCFPFLAGRISVPRVD